MDQQMSVEPLVNEMNEISLNNNIPKTASNTSSVY
jgi:hypothetical protein